MDYDDLCDRILRSDIKVRFAGICDETGEIRYGGPRKGLKNLLTPEETRRSLLQALARWRLRDELSAQTGKGKYALAEYEKMKRITVPLDETHLLLVTTDVGANHARIIDEILKLKTRVR
ncbi:MAG TPA: hypothetical protein VD736_01240 [Nitrososphaera sp.]|nr:hypothetical protein [Nitrososphaera sp.]